MSICNFELSIYPDCYFQICKAGNRRHQMKVRASIPQLEAFYWVVRLGSIKEAARHLNMAQPTISLRISDLERQMRRPIFERNHRKLILTRYGERLLPRVTSIINELSGLRQLATNAEEIAGVVRVGLTEVLAQTCLPACMKILASQFPEVQLDITIGISADLEQSAIGRKLDLVFVINPKGDASLSMTQLGIQEAEWVASPQLGLPSTISPTTLAETTIVTSPPSTPMYQLIVEWFRGGGLEVSKVCRCTSVVMAVHLVRSGLGVGLLPLKLIENDLKSGALIKLKATRRAAPARVFSIVRAADESLSVEAVRTIFHDVISDLQILTSKNDNCTQVTRKSRRKRLK
jgi:DNA-binding transcriptional LysR family regulator